MDDQKEKEEPKPEDTGEGDKPQSLDYAERLSKAAERVELANARTEELIQRQERLAAEAIIGGRTTAGIVPEKKEETPEEYAQRVLDGKVNPLFVRDGGTTEK